MSAVEYAALIAAGKMTVRDVPARVLDEVLEILRREETEDDDVH